MMRWTQFAKAEPENIILREFAVIFQADKDRREQHRVVAERIVERGAEWIKHEHRKADQPRQAEEQSG